MDWRECLSDRVAKDGCKLKILFQPFRRHSRAISTTALGILLGLGTLLWWTRPLRSDNFVFYLPAGRDVLPIRTLRGSAYLPLVRVLNLIGKVDALRESSNRLRLWYGDKMVEVRDNNRKVSVNKSRFTLSNPVRFVDGQWLVPVEFLGSVLPQIVSEPVEYRAGADRIFVGNVKPATFSVHLQPIANGARLRMEFSSSLTFQTAARNGKWILYLGDQAIEPLEQEFRFDNPYVSDLRFDDQDGVPKLILTPKTTGLDLYPTLEDGGKVLRADIVNPVAAAAKAPAEQATSQPANAPASAASQAETAEGLPRLPSVSSLPVVVLDAGHGGSDLGAQGQNGVTEKNLVAQYVVRIRTALLATQKYRVILTRVGDADPDFDQRAIVADTAHAAVFISVHAGNLGMQSPRVAVYTYRPSEPVSLNALGPRPLFVPWNQVQMLHLDQSQKLAQTLQEQLSHAGGFEVGPVQPAPVRVLRSVDAPAVAIEAGSLSPNVDPSPLLDPDFQQKLSDAVVAALNAFTRRPS
jgi:N-acetylmuramoyl-L-alanine amidase